MKKHKLMAIAIATATACMSFMSCSDNNQDPAESSVELSYTLPASLNGATVSNAKVTFSDINTGRSQTFDLTGSAATVTVADGLYDVELSGEIAYAVNGATVTSHLRAMQNNVTISGGKATIALSADAVSAKSGFVLAEIAVSGTLTPDGDTYDSDKYFRIYNNSDQTLYADGLTIFESAFTNDDPEEYNPDLRGSALTVNVAYMIPGNGHEHPVEPGQSLLLVDVGANHAKTNANSYDLSKADFEWYDEDEYGEDTDTDVPNLIKIITTDEYGESVGLWAPHSRGVKTYAIGYLGDEANPVSVSDFLTKYKYTYTYKFSSGEYNFDMDGIAYMVPNAWIADCVNMRPQHTEKSWLCSASSLDAGFAYNSSLEYDENRYGKAVRRKWNSSTKKLVDTNNSTTDFESMVTANPYYTFK